MILEFAATRRHAVIVSTHVVETVPALCNRAAFLADGQIVQSWDKPALEAASARAGSFEANVIQALKAFSAKSQIAA
jgi:ABC-2 type transport system ATP-binding protein